MKAMCRVGLVAALVLAVLAAPVWAQEKGKPVTVTGRIVDNVCLFPAGLKGESHRECAIGCDKAGVRMALLDEKANILYTLMADAPFKDPNGPIREHLERVVTVKGSLYTAPGGQRILAVQEAKAAKAGNPCASKNPCGAKK
jgi:hypothetical protein